MDYQEKVKGLDNLISALKTLKSDYLKTDKLSNKSLNTNFGNSNQRQISKASVDLNWQCMHLDKQKKKVWSIILNSDLEVDLEETEYKPSGFHTFKT